jgi:proline iminopeptidase
MVHAGDGAYLWTETMGRGAPPVLLLHGRPGVWDYTEPMAALLEDRWQAVRFDQRGGGRSSTSGPWTFEQYVADVELMREAWGFERMVVLGHGFGASLGLRYALAHPQRVRALVYMSGTGIGRSWQQRYREEQLRRLPGRFGDRFRELKAMARRTAEEQAEYRTLQIAPDFANRVDSLRLARTVFPVEMPSTPAAGDALVAEHATWKQGVLRRALPELRMPVLVVHGDQDPRPVDALQTMLASLPDARLELLPGVGHYPWLEQPWLVGRAVREFLAELPDGTDEH